MAQKGIKIAISGKGGVGKTSLSAALAKLYQESGFQVIAVDADPDANLAAALGASVKDTEAIVPIAKLREEIVERTDAEPGGRGGFFNINPKVDDIPEKYYLDVEGIKLMVLGTIDDPGAGCICPESALLRRLTQHLIVERNDVVILDMEAGIEHLGRATAQAVDILIVVLEPGQRSLQTARKINDLAKGLGIPVVGLVINKISDDKQYEYLKQGLPDLPILGIINFRPELIEIDMAGKPSWSDSVFMDQIKPIWSAIEARK